MNKSTEAPKPEQASQSERIIAPEICNDSFYNSIVALSQFEDLTNVLEIGSSSGGGSTSAFVHGLTLNKNHPTLYCMEISRVRFLELQKSFEHLDFVKFYNVSSVSSSRVASESEVRHFYASERTSLNKYKLSEVLSWREEGLQYMAAHREMDQDGILRIKQENNIEAFDLVLIDGSEFTGMAEFNDIYGAKIICLDDTYAFKCHAVRRCLLADPAYELLAENQKLRNGFSIFYRASACCRLRAVMAVLNAMQSGKDSRKLSLRRGWRDIRKVFKGY